jgi:periplasmic protein TonB
MSLEPEPGSRQNLGSLQGCLVEGDPEQRARERRVRRKALITSVLLQAGVLLALILVPLFAKPAHLVMAITTPIPPYRRLAAAPQDTPRSPDDRRVCVKCFNSRPVDLTSSVRTESNQPKDPFADSPGNDLPAAPCPGCIDIGRTAGPAPPSVPEPRREKPRVVHEASISPAMLVHRVEPIYPVLARQTGRSGRVELRAVIATDGTIQSLEVVSGDPLFYQSAIAAVREWRYRPTMLNGAAVEVDTFITVIYNLGR